MSATQQPCPSCGSTRASVVITVADRTITMSSCNGCDRRWWSSEGADVDPTEVFAAKSA